MSKIYSGLRTAKVNVMSNMSAKILRDIVSRKFNVNLREVLLSGKIQLIGKNGFSIEEEWSTSVYSDRKEDSEEIFSFCVEKGFHELDVVLSSYYELQPIYENGPKEWEKVHDIHTPKYGGIVEALKAECPESIFIVIIYSDKRSDGSYSYRGATVFEAPNLK